LKEWEVFNTTGCIPQNAAKSHFVSGVNDQDNERQYKVSIYGDCVNGSSFIDFQVWDFPGQIDFFDPTFDLDSIFGEMGALIFVIDAVVLSQVSIVLTNVG